MQLTLGNCSPFSKMGREDLLEAAGNHSSHLSWQAGHAMHVGLLPPGELARRGLCDPRQGTVPLGMRSDPL